MRRSKGMVGYSGSGGQFASRRSFRQFGSSAFVPTESGSLFGLRRSLRLRSKSAMTMSVEQSRKRRNSRNPKPQRPLFWAQPGEMICRGGYMAIPRILREQRTVPAYCFRNAYSDYLPTSDRWDKVVENRIIVASGLEHPFSDVGRSHGIMWVGVHGINSISAIFLNKEPDMQRIIDRLGDKFPTYFMKYVLSEMEDIADTPPYSNVIGGKPFAVVSLPDYPADGESADEESCREVPAPSVQAHGKVVEYLKTKMINRSAFSKRRSLLIAISAFQHLCQKKLKAEDFMVCYFYEEFNEYEIKMLSTSKKKKLLLRLLSEEGENVPASLPIIMV